MQPLPTLSAALAAAALAIGVAMAAPATAVGSTAGATAHACTSPIDSVALPPGPANVVLRAVDGSPATGLWTVGAQSSDLSLTQPLVLRSQGGDDAAEPVLVPRVPGRSVNLTSVATIGPADTWIGGNSSGPHFDAKPLALHWDGASLTSVPLPDVPSPVNVYDDLQIVGRNSTDVWGSGSYFSRGGDELYGYVLHYDGSTWRRVPFPDVESVSTVLPLAADDVWAGGDGLFRWDGTTWGAAPMPAGARFVIDLAGRSSNDLFGTFNDVNSTQFVAHWDGSAWTELPKVAAELGSVRLQSLSVAPDGTLWVAGADEPSVFLQYPFRPYLARWDGTRWLGDSAAGSGGGFATGRLEGVVGLSATDARAVGSEYGQGTYTPYAVRWCTPTVFPWGVRTPWVRVPLGAPLVVLAGKGIDGPRTVRDSLGLFTSAPFGAGAGVQTTYPSAGTYTAVLEPGGQPLQTAVGLTLDHRPDGPLVVAWALQRAPAGYRYDVQIQRPGTPAFVELPAGGPPMRTFNGASPRGDFRMRARLVRTADGAASGWSPVLQFQLG